MHRQRAARHEARRHAAPSEIAFSFDNGVGDRGPARPCRLDAGADAPVSTDMQFAVAAT